MRMDRFLVALLVLGLATLTASGVEISIANPSFEKPLRAWKVEFSPATYENSPAKIDTSTVRAGKRSLRITSTNRFSEIIVQQTIQRETAGKKPGRCEITCHILPKNQKARGGVLLIVSTDMAKARFDKTLEPVVVRDVRLKDGWIERTVRFTPSPNPFKLAVVIANYEGTVWIDDFHVRAIDSTKLQNDGLWYYDPRILDRNGRVTRRRFWKLLDTNSPFIERAKKYNDLLTDLAFLRDDAKRLERACAYSGSVAGADVSGETERLFEQVDAVNKAYTTAYGEKNSDILGKTVDPALRRLA